ncbi:hypothetical protein PIB30_081358 [Stylosanthes scabra]|uniref:Uncharacterized protein n=1 Tax=Stylosanthes scabra TaxID=79078 RepID=A0ABU6UTF0_9FABA|nr:hypothetical protein [Stylosanthes scabra]
MPHQERDIVKIPPHKIPDFLHSNVANKKDLTLELSNRIYNKENPPKLLTKLPKILLILRIKISGGKMRMIDDGRILQNPRSRQVYRIVSSNTTVKWVSIPRGLKD